MATPGNLPDLSNQFVGHTREKHKSISPGFSGGSSMSFRDKRSNDEDRRVVSTWVPSNLTGKLEAIDDRARLKDSCDYDVRLPRDRGVEGARRVGKRSHPETCGAEGVAVQLAFVLDVAHQNGARRLIRSNGRCRPWRGPRHP